MDGVAERVENCRNLTRDCWGMPPNIRHRQRDVFGECARPVDADALRVGAQMPPPRQAISALPANDVAFAADDVARRKSADVRSDLNDFTDKFMADDEADRDGLPRPFVPLVDMEVRSADSRGLHAD
jgi:hypothetical protein